jgi:DNA-binding NtrC family response regulator
MKEDLNIVIVDDDDYIRLSLKVLLDPHYSKITCLSSAEEIPDLLLRQSADVMLLDMNFTAGDTSCRDGIHWLRRVRELSPETNVILITAYSDITVAVDAIKLGAIDFIVKPWENGKILATVHSAAKLSRSQKTVSFLKDRQQALDRSCDPVRGEMVGDSPSMKKIFETIGKVAPTDANILILGENGTGKELIARAIHKGSARAGEIFMTVDLSSIAETLFESELFGHVRGAFTDAKENRIGRFEAASGGTLFLDEIGNLSMSMQAKLLAVLQNRSLNRVGSNRMVGIDVRLVCATNKPLEQMIRENHFRQDLLYRINTVQIELPPLRERKGDIPLLVNHFLSVYAKKYNKLRVRAGDGLLERLMQYHWPGNVRELQHAVERALILCNGSELTWEDFRFSVEPVPETVPAATYDLDRLEKKAIIDCLLKHSGNISKAAPELGLTRGALYRRLEKYGI